MELLGGKQTTLGLTAAIAADSGLVARSDGPSTTPRRARSRISQGEREAHAVFFATLGSNPIWKDYLPDADAP